jgi:UDP-N-acetyl-D-glucosamine dehydrogenase
MSTDSTFDFLKSSIAERKVTVGVIGLGYVGLPLADTLHTAGLRVLGFDIDESKMGMLERGESYLSHLGQDMFDRLAKSDRFSATNDLGRLGEADVVLVCVPTPIGEHHEPDLSYVVAAADSLGAVLRKGQLFVLVSTSFPGTTRDYFLPAIEARAKQDKKNLVCGEDYFVAFSPEREDPGRESHSTRTIPKLVGGLDDKGGELAVDIYKWGIDEVIRVESAEIAEAGKLLENVFRAVNIALVNEVKVIFDAIGIDVWQVIQAASTKPFGFMPFYPGPGLGGHCIPVDPFYLTWRAKEVGHMTRFIELAGEINRGMPKYVVQKTAEALNAHKKAMNGSNILVLGVAYKPNVNDMRETPAAEIIERLQASGADVSYHDPFVPTFPVMRNHQLTLQSQALSVENLKKADCVLVVTHHDRIDWKLVGEHSRLVVDTRNVMASVQSPKAQIVKC